MDDKMLGPGKYVFRNGSEQHGEYVIEQDEGNKENGHNGNRQDDIKKPNEEFVTKWRCRKKTPPTDPEIPTEV